MDSSYKKDKIDEAILLLLGRRSVGASICPSEVARYLSEDWRELMEPVRQSARSLMLAGVVEITQRGEVVNPQEFKGPVRIRLKLD